MTIFMDKFDSKDKKHYCLILFRQMKRLCENPESLMYFLYGGKGVKCLFTSALEIEHLYERDHAKEMKEPFLSRRKWNGNFSRRNCFFREEEDDYKAVFKRIAADSKKEEQACIKRQEMLKERRMKKIAKQEAEALNKQASTKI